MLRIEQTRISSQAPSPLSSRLVELFQRQPSSCWI
jgi:hypothetical protein